MKIKHLKFFNKLTILLVCVSVLYPTTAFSFESSASLVRYFDQQIANINQTLLSEQKDFAQYPDKLVSFVDTSLLPLWSPTKTLKGLLGKDIWSSLSIDEKRALNISFNNTIQRYVQEGFAKYDGQQFEFVALKLNKRGDRGYLTVKFKPNVLPDFDVDFKVYKHDDNWLLYDVLVKGASYIYMKKSSYRALFEESGIQGLLIKNDKKNEGFKPSKLTSCVTCR